MMGTKRMLYSGIDGLRKKGIRAALREAVRKGTIAQQHQQAARGQSPLPLRCILNKLHKPGQIRRLPPQLQPLKPVQHLLHQRKSRNGIDPPRAGEKSQPPRSTPPDPEDPVPLPTQNPQNPFHHLTPPPFCYYLYLLPSSYINNAN